ncbi:MAG: antitoxin component YwqK of YwqJK toxin-antitoxin module/peroxiredoxin [Planctomycetota bacterium]|jgi:antitoxin component YwqK of YwqJK toxin-antitoxin module/peroxiredoxin
MVTRSLLACTAGILLLTSCGALEEFIQRDGREGTLLDGRQSGMWTYVHSNGALSSQGEYRKDRQFGPWTYWYSNGEKEWEVEFSEDYIAGPSTFYFPSGQKRAEGEFQRGVEDGLWRYWNEDGTIQRKGQFSAGLASGRWTYFHGDGAPLAEGFYYKGDPVGSWQHWDEAGRQSTAVLSQAPEAEVVVEEFAGGGTLREGFSQNQAREGRWVSFHSTGAPRAQGTFRRGKHNGTWTFFSPGGELLAQGEMVSGAFKGRWNVRIDGELKSVASTSMETLEPFRGEWSADDLASREGVLAATREWAEEIDKPFGRNAAPAVGTTAASSAPGLASVMEASFELPMRAQPWTESELEAQEFLIDLYTVGATAATPPPGSKYVAKTEEVVECSELKGYGDTELAEGILGQPLSEQVFRRVDGTRCDISLLRDKSNVVVVILRGVGREICIYCWAQTKAILTEKQDFLDAGAEIVIVYPGPKSRIETFMESVEEEEATGRSFDDVEIVYDPDMRFVRNLRLLDRQAIPSTFILDRQGAVRYAYIGVSDEDRPSTSDLLTALSRLPKP